MDQPQQWATDCLPNEQIYQSREALVEAVNQWAKPRGYALITRRSHRAKSSRLTVTLVCDRAYKPLDKSVPRKRNTGGRGTQCPFSILAKQQPDLTS